MTASSTVSEMMSAEVETCEPASTLHEAADKMHRQQIGDVVITEDGQLRGLLTDRDIVIRAIAEGKDPETTPVSEICTTEVSCLAPEDPADQAVQLMRSEGIRRIPVVKDQQLVGIVSLGDLALQRDPKSALAEISGAVPND